MRANDDRTSLCTLNPTLLRKAPETRNQKLMHISAIFDHMPPAREQQQHKKKNPWFPGVSWTCNWWPRPGSNRRHADFQSAALPTELPSHMPGANGRGAGIRTLDPVIKSHLLYQLSYAPIHCSDWSELRDSNPRQPPWQGGTLPTELSSPVGRKREKVYHKRGEGARGKMKKNKTEAHPLTKSLMCYNMSD